jgi:hypothetical protein
LPDLVDIINDIGRHLNEYSFLINDFNNTASHNNIDFKTQSGHIPKPAGMTETVFHEIMEKLAHSGEVIQGKKRTINSLFNSGAPLALQFQNTNPEQFWEFTHKVNQFTHLASKFKGD